MTLNARSVSTPDFAARRRYVRIAPQSESHPAPYSSPTVSPVRVLIAGDHPTLRSCLKTMLELDPQISVVGEAADDCELVKMAHRVRPDVVLIDIDRRCSDSFDAVAEIMQGRLASSVVALTIHDDAEERAEAQRAGVDLFLEKGVPYKQLISAVRLAAINSSKR
jgi:two-component system, NarL family, nitrate/nitrite response regulator NarL